MQRVNLANFNALFLLVGLISTTVLAEPPKRLHSNIQSNQTFVLKGHIHPLVAHGIAQDQGAVSSSKEMPHMALQFQMTPAQQADLANFLAAVQDRRSPSFHKFLTTEQYAERFGMNTADLAKVKAWLEGNGFTNVEPSRSRTWINFDGNAGLVEMAFHTAIHNYKLNGEAHLANVSDPELPKQLSGVVMGVHGMHNFFPKAHYRRLKPHFTSNISGDTFITPDDWAAIYDVKALYNAGWDGSPIAAPSGAGTYCGGSPCSIAIVGQSDVVASDLAHFRSGAGLAAKVPTQVVPPGDSDPGLQLLSGDEGESDLDLEWANAIAPNANILFVTACAGAGNSQPVCAVGNGVEDSLQYAIDNNVAPIISTSYGLCESEDGLTDINFQEGLFQQANAQGMTLVSAAGDAGAADCDTGYPATLGLAVDYPAASTYVTGVGGTQVNYYVDQINGVNVGSAGSYWNTSNNSNGGSAVGYIPEQVWNDTNSSNGLASGGGGVSIYQSKPNWQAGTGVPNDGFRDVPDIALTASPQEAGLLYCTPPDPTSTTAYTTCTSGFRNSDSTLNVTGGTSAGAPTFAGVLALLVQKNGARLGNVNPNLYALASAVPNSFHDITTGSNIVPCTVGSTPDCTSGFIGYSAGVGYDQASGWGSIDAFNMIDQWGADISISSNPTSFTLQPGASQTSTITVGSIRGFAGTVSFACTVPSSLAGVTCNVPSTTVSTSGTTTVTITAASTAGSPWWRKFRTPPPAGMGLLLSLLALALMTTLFLARKQQRRVTLAWGAMAMLMVALGTVSCGGSSSSSGGGGGGGTTAESGNIIVTATSGLIKNQVEIAVSIP